MLPRRFELLLFALVAAFSASARAEDGQGLLLETGSPDAFCPDLAQTRDAVSRRLGSLQVEGRRGWRARYTIGHAPEGSPRDFVRLELFNPEGAIELVRDLPMSGESCSTMAEVIALVLDRHFRSISPEEREAPHVEGHPAVRGRQPAPLPSPPPAASGSLRVSGSEETKSSGARILAELALTTARPPALGVRVLAPLARSLQWGGLLLFDLAYEREQLAMGGQARAARGELRSWMAWSAGRGPWSAYAGPSLSLSLQRGETTDLPDASSLLRVLWAAGLEGGASWCFSQRLALELSGSVSVTPRALSGRFYVDDQEVLRPPVLTAQLGLAAGYAF